MPVTITLPLQAMIAFTAFQIVGQQFGQVFDGRSLGIDRIDSTLSDRIHLVIGLFFVKSRPRLRSVKKDRTGKSRLHQAQTKYYCSKITAQRYEFNY